MVKNLMAWKRFDNGKRLPKAGIQIVQRLRSGKTQTETRYIVRYDCCDFEEEITHAQIVKRERALYLRCRYCRKKQIKHKAPYGVEMPSWPVPPSCLR